MAESSAEVRRPEELDIAVEEDWYGKPLWEKKFRSWQSLIWKGCPAKSGPGGRYCTWVGQPCFYNGCPRRIFEEVAVVADSIPRPEPTPDFVGEFNTMKKQLEKFRKQLKKANEKIKELENEKKED